MQFCTDFLKVLLCLSVIVLINKYFLIVVFIVILCFTILLRCSRQTSGITG